MAKPLGPKAILIREAITAHPGKGNKEIAEMLNDADERMDDHIKVKPSDVAQQRQAMKKVREPATATEAPVTPAASTAAEKPDPRPRKPRATPARTRPPATSPVELIDRVFILAEQCGGMEQLKRLVDRLAR